MPRMGSQQARQYQSCFSSSGVSHGLEPCSKAKLCPAVFLDVSGNGTASPYIFCFLLLTSTKQFLASGCGPRSVPYQFDAGAAPLRTSFEAQLPRGEQEGEWAYSFICCLHQKESSN